MYSQVQGAAVVIDVCAQNREGLEHQLIYRIAENGRGRRLYSVFRGFRTIRDSANILLIMRCGCVAHARASIQAGE